MKGLVSIVAVFAGMLPIWAAAANVGVGVAIEELAEYYGRIDVQSVPAAWLVYEKPQTIEPAAGGSGVAPIYLRVPAEHHRKWFKYCREYQACGQPVYFVKDSWYKKMYKPASSKDRSKARAKPVIIMPVMGAGY